MQQEQNQHKHATNAVITITTGQSNSVNQTLEADEQKIQELKQKLSLFQSCLGILAGTGLLVTLYATDVVNLKEEDEPDALLLTLYILSAGLTAALRVYTADKLNTALDKTINYATCKQTLDTAPRDFSTKPLFESFGLVVQLAPVIKYLQFLNSNNPLNWLSLLAPPAGLLAGNLVGRTTDKALALFSWAFKRDNESERTPLLHDNSQKKCCTIL